MSGWIKIHRKLVAHWLRKDPVKFTWWVIMLLEVNHSANKISLGNSIFRIERGQSAKSLRSWAAIFETGTKAVTNFFDLLESDGMITRQTIGKGKHSTTLINITNYNEYQGGSETQGLTQDYTQGQREGHTNNNDNNTKNEKNGKEEDAATSEILNFYQKHRKENWVDLNNISERENSEIQKLLTKFSLQDIKQTIIAATESEYYQDFDLVKFANIFKEENAIKLLRGEFKERKLLDNGKTIVNPYKSWNAEEFKGECEKYKKEFGAKTLTDFFRYWKQPTEEGVMRFQERTAWDTEDQLKMWRSKQKEFSK